MLTSCLLRLRAGIVGEIGKLFVSLQARFRANEETVDRPWPIGMVVDYADDTDDTDDTDTG